MLKFIQEYDVLLLDFFNDLGSKHTDYFWLFITKKHVWFPFFIVLFLLGFKKFTKKQTRIILSFGFIMFAINLGLTEITKSLFERLRPCNNILLDGVFRELLHPNSYSFYSGHASSSVSISVYFVTLLRKHFKLIYILILWSLLFVFSRLYLAVHYPSDILVGTLVGVFVARLFVILVRNKLRALC